MFEVLSLKKYNMIIYLFIVYMAWYATNYLKVNKGKRKNHKKKNDGQKENAKTITETDY